MFSSDPVSAAVGLPAVPLDDLYATPARAFIEARGGSVHVKAQARVELNSDGGIAAVYAGGTRVDTQYVISAVPWFALRNLFGAEPPLPLNEILTAASTLDSMPIVTVNLWYDRPVMDDAFVGLPGRALHWVFSKRFAFGETASALTTLP